MTFSSEIISGKEYSRWKYDLEDNDLELLEFGEL
jgi:hypothetical protein